MKNKNISLKKLILVATLFLMSFGAFAQDNNGKQEKKTEISVEFDPLSLFYYGFGGHLKIKPKNSEHLLLGIGFYASYYPKITASLKDVRPASEANKSSKKGWNIKPLQSYSLSGEYHLSEVNKKWFFGAQLVMQEQRVDGLGATVGTISEDFTSISFMGYGGYTWKPFKFNLYIKPWVGVGYVSRLSSSTAVNHAKEYSLQPFAVFGSVNLGYTF